MIYAHANIASRDTQARGYIRLSKIVANDAELVFIVQRGLSDFPPFNKEENYRSIFYDQSATKPRLQVVSPARTRGGSTPGVGEYGRSIKGAHIFLLF